VICFFAADVDIVVIISVLVVDLAVADFVAEPVAKQHSTTLQDVAQVHNTVRIKTNIELIIMNYVLAHYAATNLLKCMNLAPKMSAHRLVLYNI